MTSSGIKLVQKVTQTFQDRDDIFWYKAGAKSNSNMGLFLRRFLVQKDQYIRISIIRSEVAFMLKLFVSVLEKKEGIK